jgi:universal stress protein A
VVSDYRQLLCPVDASPCSKAALSAALELARRFGARVLVLHAYHVPAYVEPGVLVWAAVGPRPIWQLAEERASTEIDQFLADLSDAERARIDVHLEVGDPAVSIVQAAHRVSADLVVMGTHGRTGARRMVLGSVAERVVRLAPCPVLVIPHPVSLPEGAST